jgi:hypothetical protein
LASSSIVRNPTRASDRLIGASPNSRRTRPPTTGADRRHRVGLRKLGAPPDISGGALVVCARPDLPPACDASTVRTRPSDEDQDLADSR